MNWCEHDTPFEYENVLSFFNIRVDVCRGARGGYLSYIIVLKLMTLNDDSYTNKKLMKKLQIMCLLVIEKTN